MGEGTVRWSVQEGIWIYRGLRNWCCTVGGLLWLPTSDQKAKECLSLSPLPSHSFSEMSLILLILMKLSPASSWLFCWELSFSLIPPPPPTINAWFPELKKVKSLRSGCDLGATGAWELCWNTQLGCCFHGNRLGYEFSSGYLFPSLCSLPCPVSHSLAHPLPSSSPFCFHIMCVYC